MVAFPASLALGIVGIVRDDGKGLAILATILAGAIVFFFFVMPILC
jgi:hypothetical protein